MKRIDLFSQFCEDVVRIYRQWSRNKLTLRRRISSGDVDRVEVLADVRVVLIREGGRECGSSRVGHGVSIVGKVGDSTLGSSMTLDVRDYWVSVIVLLLKVCVADLDEPFDLVANVYISGTAIE